MFFKGFSQETQGESMIDKHEKKEDIFEDVYNIQKNIKVLIKEVKVRIKELAESENDNN